MKPKNDSHSSGSRGGAARPVTREQIAALAHAIWIDRGRPDGRDLDHWLEAERQLRGDVRRPAAADELPADPAALRLDAKLDPDAAIKGPVEKQLDRMTDTGGQRSPTALG